ncbi:alpha/beta hydrolase [Vagococcus zengguangii]|uniref:Alpha/beta hydrolase n=1 Tax=Vagococcus zengguangii TaxID=2571750 RepID=A0A4D7CXP9_9ENTE|nr:alpha/beta hydrolase [Vagococcus zengguangii]QCI87271.1 alpha/beta hydrolase [Vagococcus zengguangii]TLG80775.1 alpha/beta hydrolase [Vagococcus zengguangii]
MKKFFTIVLSLLVLIIAGSAVYLKMATYSATSDVSAAIKEHQTNVTVKEDKLAWQVTPVDSSAKKLPAVIYYPGGLVKPDSYVPFALNLAEAGYPVYIAKMPLNLAVFKANKADQLIDAYNLTDFVIGGHSLGGTMASRFANTTTNIGLKGVFFLASYPDEKGELISKNLPVLSIKGSQDGVLNAENYETARDYLPTTTQYKVIEGGNHGQFGSYGEQEGDKQASITSEEQLTTSSDLMLTWLDALK